MPHDDPCVGFVDERSGQVCGRCRAGVARAWRVTGIGKGGSPDLRTTTFQITTYRGDGYVAPPGALVDNSTSILVGPANGGWTQFQSIPLDPGSVITAATLTITANVSVGSPYNYSIDASPTSSQTEAIFATFPVIARTAAKITGTLPSTTSGTAYTFDVKSIVQEILNGSYWARNGSILFFLEPTASGATFSFAALDNDSDLPFSSTTLSITYTVPGIGDAYINCFMGDHLLQRSIPDFQDNLFQACVWGTSIDLSAIGGPGNVGNIKLEWTSVEGDGGGDQWFLVLLGLPALGAAPADVAFYKLNAFAFSPIDNRPFRCLSPNTFWREDLLGGGNFPVPGLPDSLLVQPFWP